jgi:pyruvate dehydrogenase E2 component (dihydrolipoamide acetyltransferase)
MFVIRMPRLGVTMTSGKVSVWHKQEGDRVEKGELLLEVESDKANVEIEAPEEGILRKILVPEGVEVPVNTPLAVIAAEDEEIDLSAIESPQEEPEPQEEQVHRAEQQQRAEQEYQAESPSERQAPPESETPRVAGTRPPVKATPRVRRLAVELGVALEQIKGTGPGGVITEEDVRRAHREGQGGQLEDQVGKPAGILPKVKEIMTLNHVQRRMAEHMTVSWQQIPQFSQTFRVNMERVLRLKEELEGVTINDILARIIGITVAQFPMVNSRLEGDKVYVYETVNLSVAVQGAKGLVVPVVRDADKKTVIQIAQEIKQLAEKARTDRLTVDDLTGGTITFSNLGGYGVEEGVPIINAPQSTIVFAGAIRKTPVYDETERIVAVPLMKMTVCFDHRFIDGMTGAAFCSRPKEAIEKVALSDLIKIEK